MKIVWVGGIGSNDVRDICLGSVSTLIRRTSTLLFWADYLGQPLLVMGEPGAHVVTYECLKNKELFSDIDSGKITGSGTVNNGVLSGWYSSCYDVPMPEEWRSVVANILVE